MPFTLSSSACWNVDTMAVVGTAVLGHEGMEVTYGGANNMEGALVLRTMCCMATYLPNHLPVNFHKKAISLHLA